MDSRAIVKGSLAAVAESTGQSIAISFLSADVIVLVDVSGSMGMTDSRGGQQRYSVACSELAKLQASTPGRIAVVAFSTWPTFAPSAVPPYSGGGTDLAAALTFVHPADGTVQFIVISDGEPNDEAKALAIAASFTSKISTVYVGPEDELSGARFLKKLAKASGGKFVVADRAQELAAAVSTLMLAAAK